VTEVAVVTGAARGFGLEIARRLAGRGMCVVLADVDVDAVKAAAASLGEGAVGFELDVRSPAGHAAAAACAASLGRLTVWVNNAGVAWTAKAWEHSDEQVERTVGVNLLGVMHGSRAAVAAMRDTGGGRILNISSLSAHGPVPGFAVYAATKAAVVSWTGSLQGDLDVAGIPIRMHVLCPDAAQTRMVWDVVDEETAAVLFTGSGLLGVDEVADAAVELLDSRALVRTVPHWRGAVLRGSGLAPRIGLPVIRAMTKLGDRRRPSRPPAGT
jgi:NAD(P)-dependent dehydrogenase (short-subunit alcohol dehydrogenase family)